MSLKNILKFLKLNEAGVRMIIVFILIVLGGEIYIKVSQISSNSTFNRISIGDEKTLNTYTVQKGETLWKIAEKFLGSGFNWSQIAKENNIDTPNNIKEGQEIVIPTKSLLPASTDLDNPKNTSSTNTEAKTYSVKEGDTLWSIAEKEFGSGYNWVDIASANSLKNFSNLEPGQNLYIPNVNPKIKTVNEGDKQSAVIRENTYIVQKGDSLWKIAVRAYTDGYKWPEIAKANKLTNPGFIYPNQVLSIPR